MQRHLLPRQLGVRLIVILRLVSVLLGSRLFGILRSRSVGFDCRAQFITLFCAPLFLLQIRISCLLPTIRRTHDGMARVHQNALPVRFTLLVRPLHLGLLRQLESHRFPVIVTVLGHELQQNSIVFFRPLLVQIGTFLLPVLLEAFQRRIFSLSFTIIISCLST